MTVPGSRTGIAQSSRQKPCPSVAVIGTGAAALGVLTGLMQSSANTEISVFDVGKPMAEGPPASPLAPNAAAEFYDGIYQEIRSLHPFKFPPPKTHFAELLPKDRVGKKRSIFRSESFGGLTNYWGGTMLPFTDRELSKWPIDALTLQPYYERISEITGISGRRDGLNQYFAHGYCNRPPLQLTRIGARLDDVVNTASGGGSFRIFSGVNRCTLETRDSEARRCVYCGECMAGCFAGSIYSTAYTIREYLEDARVAKFVRGKVLTVDPHDRSVRYQTEDGIEVANSFSKVFLCAGCPGSTEIVMRSADLSTVAEMADNAVYVFPILYLGRVRPGDRQKRYLSLSNLILACVPRTDDLHFAQAQVYPNFDYLWRYNVPPRLWPLFRPLITYSRPRLFWARLYVDGSQSQAYQVRMEDDKVSYELARNANGKEIGTLMASIRSTVSRSGFWIPPIRPLLQKTNSHYAATLPYGDDSVNVPPNGEIFPGVYLCDSTCFSDLPAVSLTFTIMANALRTATEALA